MGVSTSLDTNGFCGADQCLKCRIPVNTIASPASFAAAITSSSRIEPPGWITQVAPASTAALVRCLLDAGLPGDIVSLLPLGGPAHGVSTQGLRYPLNGETLFPDRSRGVSNEMIDAEAHVRLDGGTLICIHTRKKEIPHVE